MSHLPSRLQPAWPYLKRAHRVASLLLGLLHGAMSPLLGERGVPRRATNASAQAAAAEPESVVVHPGGPAETIRRSLPPGDPARHWRFAEGTRADIAPRYVLEIRNGRLVGPHGASVTPRGTLDYQTSGYFGIAGWREHPLFLRPTIGRVERVGGTVLSLTTRGTAGNYYHFLYDAIARYGIFREAMPEIEVDAVVVPHQVRYQRELLQLIGVEAPLLQPRTGHSYKADRLLVPSTPNQDLDAPPWTVAWLRAHLPAQPRASTPRRLYLSRGNRPNTRRYVEEAELVSELEPRGFTVLDPGGLSVQEQIDTFNGAEIVLAPHGAGLTNITFCQPGTHVIEMFAPTYVHLGLWNIADAVGGIEYRYLVGDGATRPGRAMVGVLDDISIPVDRVLRAVDTVLA